MLKNTITKSALKIIPLLFVSGAASANTFSESFSVYGKEVAALEKKKGYVGKELPIPALKEVGPGVWVSQGSQIWGTIGNYGFNNNMTAVIFQDGVMLYNAGPNEAVAYSFHMKLKRITDKPVKWVVIENSQGHANMGASYWHDVGVKNIYSQSGAIKEFSRKFDSNLERYKAQSGPKVMEGVWDASSHYIPVDDELSLSVGAGEFVFLKNYGGGHTPTMLGVHIPSRGIVFTGDLGFNERVPGLFEDGSVMEWKESFSAMKDYSGSEVLAIPGHGSPASLSVIEAQTIGYFDELINKVRAFKDAGGKVEDVKTIDQSRHSNRPAYDALYERNARNVYLELFPEK